MQFNDALISIYRDYYLDEIVLAKRKISAHQSVDHLRSLLPPRNYQSIIDIGAGDGSVLVELDKLKISNQLHAVEISESGCFSIRQKSIQSLQSVNQFNGYNIPFEDTSFELGLAIHVLEHVEHERAFLHEISRVCDFLYIEVPLELSLRIKNNINAGRKFGHINFYNQATFVNLLNSCDLEILNYKTFSASIEYEKHIASWPKGHLKYLIKSSSLKYLPAFSQLFFTYMAGAFCRVRKTSSNRNAFGC